MFHLDHRLFSSIVCITVFYGVLSCSVQNRVLSSDVLDTNSIIIKDYRGRITKRQRREQERILYSHLDIPDPTGEWGHYIVLNPAWESKSAQGEVFRFLRNTYYDHSGIDRYDDIGTWYIQNDTLFLEPISRVSYSYPPSYAPTFPSVQRANNEVKIKEISYNKGIPIIRKFVMEGDILYEVSSPKVKAFILGGTPNLSLMFTPIKNGDVLKRMMHAD